MTLTPAPPPPPPSPQPDLLMQILKSPLCNGLGIFIGLLGAVLTLFAWLTTIRERKPVFLVDNDRISIIDRKNISPSDLRILDSNQLEIDDDINLVKFYFFNSGRKTIFQKDQLEKLKISFANKDAKIISFRILKQSRKISKINLIRHSDNQLYIDFDLLEKNDGILAQIIYQGPINTPLKPHGLILESKITYMEAKKVERLGYIEKPTIKNFSRLLATGVPYIVFIALQFFIFVPIFLGLRIDFINNEKNFERLFLCMLLSAISFYIIDLYLLSQYMTKSIYDLQGYPVIPEKISNK